MRISVTPIIRARLSSLRLILPTSLALVVAACSVGTAGTRQRAALHDVLIVFRLRVD